MRDKTIDEEIPVTKEGLLIYQKGIQKELDKYESVVKRLRNVLKQVDFHLERMNK